jgi:hypothetical protein
MARWQYDTYLIPQSRLFEWFGALPDTVTEDHGAVLHWDEHHQPPADYAVRLAVFLPSLDSWQAGVRSWGSDLGNRVDVTPEPGRVQTIAVRFDARELSVSPFLIQIVAWARHCGGVFLTHEGQVLPPGVRPLLAEIHRSSARRFVTGPQNPRFRSSLD